MLTDCLDRLLSAVCCLLLRPSARRSSSPTSTTTACAPLPSAYSPSLDFVLTRKILLSRNPLFLRNPAPPATSCPRRLSLCPQRSLRYPYTTPRRSQRQPSSTLFDLPWSQCTPSSTFFAPPFLVRISARPTVASVAHKMSVFQSSSPLGLSLSLELRFTSKPRSYHQMRVRIRITPPLGSSGKRGRVMKMPHMSLNSTRLGCPRLPPTPGISPTLESETITDYTFQ